MAIGVATQQQWVKFCEALDMMDLLEDPRFLDNEGRRSDYMNVLRPILAERLIKYTKTDVENKCRVKGIPCCAVLTIPEITDLPNTLENGYMTTMQSECFGTLKYPSIPFVLQNTQAMPFVDAPVLGHDTNELLHQAGFDEEQVKAWKENGII